MYLNVLNFHKKIIKKIYKGRALDLARSSTINVVWRKIFVCMTFAPWLRDKHPFDAKTNTPCDV